MAPDTEVQRYENGPAEPGGERGASSSSSSSPGNAGTAGGWRGIAPIPMTIFRPFRAGLFSPRYPGRCPGLVCFAPSGLPRVARTFLSVRVHAGRQECLPPNTTLHRCGAPGRRRPSTCAGALLLARAPVDSGAAAQLYRHTRSCRLQVHLSPGRSTAFRRKWFRGFSPVPMTPFSKGKKGFAGLKALVGFRLKPVLRRDCDFRAGNVP